MNDFKSKQNSVKKEYDGYTKDLLSKNWQHKKLGEIALIKRGASPRPIENPIWFEHNSTAGWVRISDITKSDKFLFKTSQNLSSLGIKNSRYVPKNNLIMSICATIGRPILTKIDVCIHDGFVVFSDLKVCSSKYHLFLIFYNSII